MRIKTVEFIIFLFAAMRFCGSNKANAQESEEQIWTDTFLTDKNEFESIGTNRYFILQPGYQLVLEGRERGRDVTLYVTVLDKTRTVDSIETRIVEEREYKDGKIVEISRNYFAVNKMDHGVYYFGEEVDIYKNGEIVDHEGAWQSGAGEAKFGLMMPGLPLVGSRYYQEIAPDVVMDRAEIVSVDESTKTPAGIFDHCVRIEETTPLEPDEKEYKTYAPGIGLIEDGTLTLVKYGFLKQ